MYRFAVRFSSVFVLLLSGAAAQESTGSISGDVTDPSGAAVPRATIVVTSVQTGIARKETSNASGSFVVTNLPVGDYSLTAEAAGFKKFEATKIRLDVNDRLKIPVHLEIGGTTETISVNESGAQLQTQSAELSDLIGAKQTQALPLNGRVFHAVSFSSELREVGRE